MLFDTHTHVNFQAYKEDRDEVIRRALSESTWMINVGTQASTSQQAIDLAKQYPEGVYAAIGLHPVHTYQQMLDEEEDHFRTHEENFDEAVYALLLSSNRAVAIGECGLDYYRLPENDMEAAIKKQKTAFISQIHFAQKHGLPLIVHCRDLPANGLSRRRWQAGAYDDVLEILKAEYKGQGVIHSFTGNWETAKKFLDFGFYVAFNGILTFDKTGNLAEVCKNTPIDKILSETDAPYLTPPPFRGKRNEPSYVKYVVEKIAEVKGLSVEEASQATFNNACQLFGINPHTTTNF